MDRLRAICLPSSDVAFAAVVERKLADGNPLTTVALETALHPLFPAAAVRARDLSGEPGTTWYVYRDGQYVPPGGRPWWEVPDVPRVLLAVPGGEILHANAAIAELLGTTPRDMVGRPYLDFVAPDAMPAAAVLFETCIRLGLIETVVRVRRPDGETRIFEVRATLQAAGIEILYRPVGLAGERRAPR